MQQILQQLEKESGLQKKCQWNLIPPYKQLKANLANTGSIYRECLSPLEVIFFKGYRTLGAIKWGCCRVGLPGRSNNTRDFRSPVQLSVIPELAHLLLLLSDCSIGMLLSESSQCSSSCMKFGRTGSVVGLQAWTVTHYCSSHIM